MSALISGGASGVGRATAHRFAQEGAARVTLFDKDAGRINDVVAELADGDAHYGVSKAGIISLVKTMAIELVEHDIRVNCVSPGPLDTPMSLALLGSEEAMEAARESWPIVPMNRLGLPTEIAGTYAYLASADGAYTTGQNIVVDGGMTSNVFPVADELA